VSNDDLDEPERKLAELRAHLKTGLARKRLTQTELAAQAHLSRTTVSQALSSNAPPPSEFTIRALANELGLEDQPLVDLLFPTVEAWTAASGGLGRPIADWEPFELEVHPAVEPPARGANSELVFGDERGRSEVLPGYVPRPHDEDLTKLVDAALRGRSQMAVLAGDSATGKTRACWEAVQPLAQKGWRLWHPFDPTRAEAALADTQHVGSHTVVWLNEAQHYFGAEAGLGERIAAALRTLLTDRTRKPVLILGTLWLDYAEAYISLPERGGRAPEPYPQVRELLADRIIPVPDDFAPAAIAVAESFGAAGDRHLAHALRFAKGGRLTQFLAGAPELLALYKRAAPPVRALLDAAIDARRFGVGPHLPLSFLEYAAADYLSDDEYDDLTDNWLAQTLAASTKAVHGKIAALRRIRPRASPDTGQPECQVPAPLYRLHDILEQYGRHERRHLCPPASFWKAAHRHITRHDDLVRLAQAARSRQRLRWAAKFWRTLGDAGDTDAMKQLASIRADVGDRESAERILQQVLAQGDEGVLMGLARMREAAGDTQDFHRLLQRAVDAGDPRALFELARLRAQAHDWEAFSRISRKAAEADNANTLAEFAKMREQAGDPEGAEELAQDAFRRGRADAYRQLAMLRTLLGHPESAERLLRRAGDAGDTDAIVRLSALRERAGDLDGAEQVLEETGDTSADILMHIAGIRERGGDAEGAERYLQRAAADRSSEALIRLALLRSRGGDQRSADHLLRHAVIAGDDDALVLLVQRREWAGDQEGAEQLARQAADVDRGEGLIQLARDQAGKG
jgi:transcriptional regulator with XRE-family HTH domain